MLDLRFTFRTIFYKKHKLGEILFQEGATSINNLSFPKHDDRGKAHVMMFFHCEIEKEVIEKMMPNVGSYRNIEWG